MFMNARTLFTANPGFRGQSAMQKIDTSGKWLPDVPQTSRDFPWALFDSADSAVMTRMFVILALRAQTAT